MPVILRASREADFEGTKHHGGGIMARGGFDVEEVDVPVAEYARRLVLRASSDVAYRKWKAIECVTLDERFYLFCDEKKQIVLCRVGMTETLGISENENWRPEAKEWVAKNYENDPISDVVLSRTCAKFGESL